MDEQSQSKPAGCTTFWFAASVIWLFLFAHIFDDVRHGTENLFLLFIIPFAFIAVAVSILVNRLFWHHFPNLAPRSASLSSTPLPVYIALLFSLVIATLWGKSPFFIWFYDSCKIMLLVVVSGLLLGLILKVGGRFSIFASFLSAALSAITAYSVLLLTSLLSGGGKDLSGSTLFFASIVVPYVVATTLYDCYCKALTAS